MIFFYTNQYKLYCDNHNEIIHNIYCPSQYHLVSYIMENIFLNKV